MILYQLVSGQLPFLDGAGADRGTRLPERPSRLAKGFGRRWDTAILGCLAPAPEKRVRSASQVASILAGGRRRPAKWAAALVAAASIALAIPPVRERAAGALRPEQPPAHVAILPFQSSNDAKDRAETVTAVLHDLSERLRRMKLRRGKLVVIPLEDVLRAGVRRPEDARSRLDATHVLHGSFEDEQDGAIAISAMLSDARTLDELRKFKSSYKAAEVRDMPGALAGVVTAGLHLDVSSSAPPMTEEAHGAWVRGMSFLRRSFETTDLAIDQFRKAMGLDPSSPIPHAGLAEAYCSKYQMTMDSAWLEKARQALEEAERRQPDAAPVRLAFARLHRQEGSYEKAIADYLRAIELDPRNADAFLGLAQAYERASARTEDAIAAYRRAIEVRPSYFLSHLEFGRFNHRLGRYREAEEHFSKVITIAPELVNGQSSLGALYVDMRRYPEAERLLRRSLELRPSRADAMNLGAALDSQGRYSEALVLYQRALEIGPATEILMLALGDLYRRSRAEAKAIRSYRQGLDLAERNLDRHPADGYPRSLAGYFAARLGDRGRAEREIRQALQFSPRDPRVRRRAVLIFECLGKRQQAIELLRDEKSEFLRDLDEHPDLVSFRRDPGFVKLLALSASRQR